MKNIIRSIVVLIVAVLFVGCDLHTHVSAKIESKPAVATSTIEMEDGITATMELTEESAYQLGILTLKHEKPLILEFYEKDGITEKERQHIIDFGKKTFKEALK